jgi:hypothetical protein
MDLKERAIYQLPNGRQLFARITREQQVVLYNLNASEKGQYELNADGRLLFNGQMTAWEIADLLETGRVAPPEVMNAVIENPR